MVHLLHDASPEVRMNAMIALASYGAEAAAALPALRKWTGPAARAAIERISGNG
jgi:hypothetical protein